MRGIKLDAEDRLVSMEVVTEGTTILTVTDRGYGKRTRIEEYRVQGRGGKGIINIKVSHKNGPAAIVRQVRDEDQILIVTMEGKMLRTPVDEIRHIGRNTMGVKIMDMDEGDRVVSVARLEERKEGQEVDVAPPLVEG